MEKDMFGVSRLKVNLHMHTTISDGSKTPEEAAEIYKKAGYDVVAITDHWIHRDSGEIGGLRILSGAEYNIGGGDASTGVYHILGIGCSKKPNLTQEAGPQKIIDEIHRFNKGQQDYLLPFVEDGTIILIGATTENPYFEVNPALISRSIIFELHNLEKEDIKELIKRAVSDPVRGMGSYHAMLDDDAAEFLSDAANGDARAALNGIELAVLTTDHSDDGMIHITLDTAQECIQKRAVRYDKSGDNHYDTISAFIKSMRGSDPDAAVYYLARMLYTGEDIRFIARRIMICASEDVGNADPQALVVAVAASQAIERIGMPEAQIILSHAATYVACAPKSNAAYMAISEAMNYVQNHKTPPVPSHLQDTHYKSAGKLGHGDGYKYAHDYKNHYVKQQYLPDTMENEHFYRPSENGYERTIVQHLTRLHAEAEDKNNK